MTTTIRDRFIANSRQRHLIHHADFLSRTPTWEACPDEQCVMDHEILATASVPHLPRYTYVYQPYDRDLRVQDPDGEWVRYDDVVALGLVLPDAQDAAHNTIWSYLNSRVSDRTPLQVLHDALAELESTP